MTSKCHSSLEMPFRNAKWPKSAPEGANGGLWGLVGLKGAEDGWLGLKGMVWKVWREGMESFMEALVLYK